MPKRELFLYHGFPENVSKLAGIQLQGVYIHPGSILVGIDLSSVNTGTRRELVTNFRLREFEVEQKKFAALVKLIPISGGRITDIQVARPEWVQEIVDELDVAIIDQDVDMIYESIRNLWLSNHDVESIEFEWNGARIRFTRLAELDVSSEALDIPTVLNTVPVGILAGVVRPDGGHSC